MNFKKVTHILILIFMGSLFSSLNAQGLLKKLQEKAEAALEGGGNGSIIFSKEPITSNEWDKTETNFSLGDKIYARIVLKGTVKEVFGFEEGYPNGKDYYYIKIAFTYRNDNSESSNYNKYTTEYIEPLLTEEDLDKDYITLDIYPNLGEPLQPTNRGYTSDDEIGGMPALFLPSEINRKSCEIKIGTGGRFLVNKESDYLAKGGIIITTGKEYIEQWKADKEAFEGNRGNETLERVELPEYFNEIHPPSKNPMLSLDNLKKMFEEASGAQVKNIVWGEEQSVDFIVVKNDLGIPEHKMLHRKVYISYTKNGNCYYIRPGFGMPYEGGGTYGEFQLFAPNFDGHRIECEKITQ